MFLHLVTGSISIHNFIKNWNPKNCIMGFKIGCVLILWLGLKIEISKSNQHSLEFGNTFVRCLLMILLIKCEYISNYFLKIINIRKKKLHAPTKQMLELLNYFYYWCNYGLSMYLWQQKNGLPLDFFAIKDYPYNY
jgi:hypothetical protein